MESLSVISHVLLPPYVTVSQYLVLEAPSDLGWIFFFFGKTMPVEVVQLSAFVMLAAIDCFVLRV